MNNNKDFFKVLWVEDDPQVTISLPRRAEKQWIDLKPFACWDDAQEALNKDFDSWDAIILDAKCKHHRDSLDNAAEFLREALMEIRAICREKGRQLNWYILTGEGGAETKSINEHIPNERMKWDGDWTEQTGKKFYSKTTEEIDILFMRVKHHANQSERSQMKTQLYRDVVEAMMACRLPSLTIDYMVDLLCNVHNNAEGKKANSIMWELRAVLESVFRAMIEEWGMLPVDFIKNIKKDQINLTWPLILLSGSTVNVDTQAFTYKQPLITNVMRYQMQNIIDYTGELIHTSNPYKPNAKTDVRDYIASVNGSAYLVYSLTMNLCNIILWFKNYVMDHPDPLENMKKWEVKPYIKKDE